MQHRGTPRSACLKTVATYDRRQVFYCSLYNTVASALRSGLQLSAFEGGNDMSEEAMSILVAVLFVVVLGVLRNSFGAG